MEQKLRIKKIAEKYNNFYRPNVKVFTSGQELAASDELRLENAEIISGVGREPDMAVLIYRAGKTGTGKSGISGVSALEKRLNLGEKVEIKAGYGAVLIRVFLGYMHEIKVHCSYGQFVEYTLICLDVKGLMKKNSSFRVSGKKKAQQVLDDILNTGAYGFLIEKKNIDALPSDFNQDCFIRGDTHYNWLCSLSEYLNYEFYCCRGELFFRKAQKESSVILELCREYGLQSVSTIVTMEGQSGSVEVNGYNRKDEKISGLKKRTAVPGPFLQKLDQTLRGYEKTLWSMELDTGKQASDRADVIMRRSLRQCSRMEAVNIGIPELRPGVCVKIKENNVESLSGTIYVEEVQHILNENGYLTMIRGIMHDF